ncbi:hypothetical protein C9374_013043 [Naegleria lovaniensis]|uniref:Uncharacterized protein n=1 Tax=Naegleria lovaniensis TaxID=51637 RepID=A0AA88KE47_NAELO|nr:uncharacterized protein C9374_013043 [Naegleria lovaniensis]KAG2372921.1 hypothetical protein C9374_013043 [Naegleria lovaniensis]
MPNHSCTIVDTLKISKPFDVKISKTNRYILVSDFNSHSILRYGQIFDLTTRLFLKQVGPYCNDPQYLCVEVESQYLEESCCYKSDALIFSHTLYTIDSTQRLSKFNLHQLVEQDEDDVRKTTTPIWEIELGNGFINGIVSVDSRIYVPFNASIQILNSKTGDKLDTIYLSTLWNACQFSNERIIYLC